MVKQMIAVDEVLKKMASEAVKQGGNLRTTVRDLTIKTLHHRDVHGLVLLRFRGKVRSGAAYHH